jgi:flagellar export protein FliJ
MADLKPLIRLRRHAVDEKQKVLADLYRQVEAFESRRAHLLEQLETERRLLDTTQQVEMIAYFGRFSEAVMRDIERINGQLSKLEMRVRAAQDDMREAFANLKRVEIVQRNRTDEEKDEASAKETRELDDIGIEGFRRNNKDEND